MNLKVLDTEKVDVVVEIVDGKLVLKQEIELGKLLDELKAKIDGGIDDLVIEALKKSLGIK